MTSLAAVIGLAAIAGGYILVRFQGYKNKSLAGLPDRPQPSITITSPQNYSQESARFPIPVAISAHSYQPIKSLQLWVNGALMGEEDTLPANTLAFNTDFVWMSGGAGKFSLVARVIAQNGDTADSPAVIVDVLAYNPPGGASNAAFDLGSPLVVPSAPGGGAPVPPPTPGQTAGSGKAGGPSFSDFLASLTVKSAPAAPGLVASVQGCAVNLQIHDLSNNEEGFEIFRSLNGAPAWDKIASLNSQSKLDWISTSDTLKGNDQASYYALAVNSAGQAESNLVSVSVDPSVCPPAKGGQQVLDINLESFDTGGAANQSYCYRSLDDIHWDRWPAAGFLNSGNPAQDPNAAKMAFDLGGLGGSGKPNSINLILECWGWKGGNLTYLGKVRFTGLDLSGLGLHSAGDGNLHIGLNIGNGLGGGKVVPFDHPIPPQSANIPFVTAWLTYDPNVCKTHLAPNAQNDLGAFLFCSPYPGYTIGKPTSNPQPYLVWMVLEHTCQAGFNSDCATIAELRDEASKLGGQVYFLLHQEDKLTGDYYGLPIGQTSYVMPMANCPGDYTATIAVDFVVPGDWALGAESNPVTIPCTQPITDTAHVKVTFDSITLNNVQDGESDPQNVELYGYFQAATSSGFTEFRNLGESSAQTRDSNNCPNEDLFQGFHTNGLAGLGCLMSYYNGTTSLSEPEMCAGDQAWFCWFSNTNTNTDFKTNNNSITVPVTDGDVIMLKTEVWDYDSASADDLVCASQNMTIPRTLFQWASISPQTLTLSSPDFGSGSCSIHVTIEAVP